MTATRATSLLLTGLLAVSISACGDDDDKNDAAATTTTIIVPEGLRPFPTDVAPLPSDGEPIPDGEHAVNITAVGDGAATRTSRSSSRLLTT